jgi:phosphatidylserine/phosphatidylglycerophosphate/cardiolipin synthase-like enzyme
VVLLIGVGEIWLQDAVAHSFYPKLLAAGVKVVEYRKTQLHAKVAVIDDDWATVGSSNVDGLSLFLNQEANVVIKDAAFAQQPAPAHRGGRGRRRGDHTAISSMSGAGAASATRLRFCFTR